MGVEASGLSVSLDMGISADIIFSCVSGVVRGGLVRLAGMEYCKTNNCVADNENEILILEIVPTAVIVMYLTMIEIWFRKFWRQRG